MKRAKKAAVKKQRPIPLTEEHFETIGRLAAVGCSQDEIVVMLVGLGLKLSVDTMQRRMKSVSAFREAYDRGLAQRNVKLRSRMFQQAMMMNGPGVHQSQFLAVNWLGMSHKIEHKHSGEIEANVELTTARERIEAKLATLAKRLSSRTTGDGSGLDQMAQIAFTERSGGN